MMMLVRGDDCDHGDDDENEDEGDILPSGPAWQVEPIEISQPTTVEPPVMIIIMMMIVMMILMRINMMMLMMVVMMIMMVTN